MFKLTLSKMNCRCSYALNALLAQEGLFGLFLQMLPVDHHVAVLVAQHSLCTPCGTTANIVVEAKPVCYDVSLETFLLLVNFQPCILGGPVTTADCIVCQIGGALKCRFRCSRNVDSISLRTSLLCPRHQRPHLAVKIAVSIRCTVGCPTHGELSVVWHGRWVALPSSPPLPRVRIILTSIRKLIQTAAIHVHTNDDLLGLSVDTCVHMRVPIDVPGSARTRLLALAAASSVTLLPPASRADSAPATVKMEGLRGTGKATTFFPDFQVSPSGLQYKDFKLGTGDAFPKQGDKVSVDWTGVTIGYQGRYFQTRNKPKGGAFADSGFDVDYLIFQVGDRSVIPAIDECVQGMTAGGAQPQHTDSTLAPCRSGECVKRMLTAQRDLATGAPVSLPLCSRSLRRRDDRRHCDCPWQASAGSSCLLRLATQPMASRPWDLSRRLSLANGLSISS